MGKYAVAVLNGGIYDMMATAYGNSTLFLFIMAGFMKMFGVNMFSLRLLGAISGTLTIPVLYVFSRRFFNQRVALVAASLLAVSNFHVHFSRIIVATSIQDALFATLGFYFFLTGLEQRSRSRMVMSGLTIGFAIYIYMGARLAIMLLPIYVGFLLIKNKKLVQDNFSNLLVFAGAWLVISAPMINYAIKRSADFWARSNQIGVIQSGWLAAKATETGQSQFKIFLDLFKQAFLTVNYNPSWGFHLSKLPMLDFITGGLFILGLVYSLYHVAKPKYLLLNGWFWSGVLVGGALIVNPAGNSYRIMIVFPVVCLFVALAWDKLMELGVGAYSANRIVHIAPSVVFIGLFTFLNLKTYFIDYGPTCSYEDTNTRLASHIAFYINDLDSEYVPYLVTSPRMHANTYRSFEFLVGDTEVTDIIDVLTGPPTFINQNQPAAFFFTAEREGELGYIRDYMPGGTVDQVYDCGNLVMIAYVTRGE
jgi:4-amino-4-deoxy-L-arabinose transferase-like glycosyltransferase